MTQALDGGPIRVRVGVHTGTPLVTGEGYVGPDVHRAARIAAAGHGGQILVSAATAALVELDGLRDLGEHRFKDLAASERVYQLGEDVFPPLKSLYRTNLPVPATPFLGRADELAEVVQLLAREDVRLLTLIGPGGTGKTRLALQAAAETADGCPDGIWWVPLAPLRDAALVPTAIAQALDVNEEPGRRLTDTLFTQFAGKRMLVLLDNAEHLLPDLAVSVSALLAANGPTFLVTSRERLRVQAEHAYAVPSLSPQDGTELFVTRARQVDASFVGTQAASELCRRLDDLPLALELAAARTAVFSPEQLLERLGQRLDLLKGGRDVDPRQATRRTTIGWSYDLLESDEQRLFARLAVFVGGCTFEAAEAVCGADADTLQSLIDKSLVRRRDGAGGPRYWMLETIREFAAEQLESTEDDKLHRRHAEFVAALAERADPHLRHGPDQQQWGDRVAEDYGNVRTAMQFGLDQAPELALRIVGNLAFFVWLRGGFLEARAWVDESLASAEGQPPQLVGRAHECGAVICERLGDIEAEAHHADEAYAAFAEIGDEHGIANALRERGKAAIWARDFEGPRAIYEELAVLADRIGDAWNGAIALNNLGDLALQAGEWEQVVDLCGRSSAIRRGLGDRWGAALALANVATAELHLGRLENAGRTVRVALEDSLEVGGMMVVAACLDVSALLAPALGRAGDAARLLGASARLRSELGSVRDAFEGKLIDAMTASVRASLGEDAFAAEFEHGRGMSLEEAAACAYAATNPGDS